MYVVFPKVLRLYSCTSIFVNTLKHLHLDLRVNSKDLYIKYLQDLYIYKYIYTDI